MLRSLKDLERYTVDATDGDIGSVEDFLLDDEQWTIRYLVVDTVKFLDGREVLISPISFREADWSTHRFHLALTMANIGNCPSNDVHKPVSRQHEEDFNQYYGYPPYWGYSGIWGLGDSPALLAMKKKEVAAARTAEKSEKRTYDIHLRSTNEVHGYDIQGTDEAIGHVEDFIVDDETWEVRYLVIDTSNWWFGKKVLVAPQWASRISWEKKVVYVEMSRDSIKNSPVYDPSLVINREYETHLYAYFGRVVYWTPDDRPK